MLRFYRALDVPLISWDPTGLPSKRCIVRSRPFWMIPGCSIVEAALQCVGQEEGRMDHCEARERLLRIEDGEETAFEPCRSIEKSFCQSRSCSSSSNNRRYEFAKLHRRLICHLVAITTSITKPNGG